jgi:hypothetical protein
LSRAQYRFWFVDVRVVHPYKQAARLYESTSAIAHQDRVIQSFRGLNGTTVADIEESIRKTDIAFLRRLQSDLIASEKEVEQLQQSQMHLKAAAKLMDSEMSVLSKRSAQQLEELRAKDMHILTLMDQLREARAVADAKGYTSGLEDISQLQSLRRDLELARRANQAHQTQNSQMAFEVWCSLVSQCARPNHCE